MRPHKPALLDVLAGIGNPGPQGWRKLPPVFVDCDRMKPVFYDGTEARVVKAVEFLVDVFQQSQGYSEFANRVPDAYEMNIRRVGIGLTKLDHVPLIGRPILPAIQAKSLVT